MDKEKLKLIVKNLELLVNHLKSEIYSDDVSYQETQYEEIVSYINDYDEVFYDEEDQDDEMFGIAKVDKKYRNISDYNEGDVL